MRKVFGTGLAISLVLVLIACTLWSFPALAQAQQALPVSPDTLAGVGAGGSILSLLGLAGTIGRGWQRMADQDKRLEKCETALDTVPAVLARLEANGLARDKRIDDFKTDLVDRLGRIEAKL